MPPGRRSPAPAGSQSDAALLLVGHGSTRYPDAGRALLEHAATIRADGHFAAVAAGFLNGSPSVADAVALLGPRALHVVPFFMEDGYFTRVAVPRALAQANAMPVRLHEPVGTHPGMADLILARLSAEAIDPPPLALVLVGHGSARAPGRAMALHRHTTALRARGQFAAVEAAFLEEAPSVGDALAAAIANAPGANIAVMGYFAGDGMHARDDLPALLAAARIPPDVTVRNFGSLGEDAGIAALILDQVRSD